MGNMVYKDMSDVYDTSDVHAGIYVNKVINQSTLEYALQQHRIWLHTHGTEGVQAKFVNCVLFGNDFSYTNLGNIQFIFCDLGCASFKATELKYSSFICSDLLRTDFTNADLSYANFTNSDLGGAKFKNAIIDHAFIYPNCWGLSSLNNAKFITHMPLACPSNGSFIGWKKAMLPPEEHGIAKSTRNDLALVQLFIPEEAKRTSSNGFKCRTNKAVVISIENLDKSGTFVNEAYSALDPTFKYQVGATVWVDNFDDNRFRECSSGIHFFIDKQMAIEY